MQNSETLEFRISSDHLTSRGNTKHRVQPNPAVKGIFGLPDV